MFKKYVSLLACALSLAASAAAQEEKAGGMTAEQFEASLKYRQGRIALPDGVATLTVPSYFRYLGPEDAEKVLVQAWGNPKGGGTLGMLFPARVSPLSKNGWGVVITYEEFSDISDKDADSINHDDLIKDMREGVAESNKESQEQGYQQTIELAGWAAKPYYDKETRKLYWAKEIKFGGDPEHTLNYKVRILGRKGVLVLNAVAGMNQLVGVEGSMKRVVAFFDFDTGHRYSDYDSKIGTVAAYGIVALVAGGIAAKAGLFTKLFALILAAKKLIIVGVGAAGALIAKMFKGKKETPETPKEG